MTAATRPADNSHQPGSRVAFYLVSSYLVFSGLSLCGSDELQKLAHCVDQKDQACVSACLKDEPANRSPEYFALAARAYLLLGQNQEAIDSIGQAVKLKPDSYDYLMEQGWLYQRSGDQVPAVRSFLLAAHIDPSKPTVFYELGMSFFLAQEYDRSVHHFEHVLQMDSKYDKAEFMLGVVEIWRGRLEEARLHFVNALKLQPHNADYLLHYGVLLAKLVEPDLALANMLEAQRLDPSNPLTRYQIGKRYREMGKFTEARKELEAAVRLRPNLSPAFYQLGAVYRRLGEEERAREAFKKFDILTQREKTEKRDPIDANLEE
jgi:tetratricopeptide (TPR) repeat protein